MSVLMLTALLAAGIILLILGIVWKNRWLRILSGVMFGILVYQLLRLVSFLLTPF